MIKGNFLTAACTFSKRIKYIKRDSFVFFLLLFVTYKIELFC